MPLSHRQRGLVWQRPSLSANLVLGFSGWLPRNRKSYLALHSHHFLQASWVVKKEAGSRSRSWVRSSHRPGRCLGERLVSWEMRFFQSRWTSSVVLVVGANSCDLQTDKLV